MTTEGAAKFEIRVIYDGIDKPTEVESHERVTAVLEQAIKLFGITIQPHMLSLFREDGTKVSEDESVSAAGLKAGTVLLLRPDAVKGGER